MLHSVRDTRERRKRQVRDSESHGRDFARRHARAVVSRLRQALSVATDTELGPLFGRTESAAGNWVHRGSVPREICERAAEMSGQPLSWIEHGGVEEERASWSACSPDQEATAPTASRGEAGVSPITPADQRVAALHGWLDAWWRAADDEEKAWLIVEIGELRRRWRVERTSQQPQKEVPSAAVMRPLGEDDDC